MTKSTGRLRAMPGVVLVLALLAAPWPAAAKFVTLEAPKTTASYYLTRKDRNLQVGFAGWYCAKVDLRLEIKKRIIDPIDSAEIAHKTAKEIIKKLGAYSGKHRGPVWPFISPNMDLYPEITLIVPPGGRKVYTRKYCYTEKELQMVRKTILTWLEAAAKREWSKKDSVAYFKTSDWAELKTDFSHTITIVAYRGLCNPAAAQRAGALVEKLGRLRQAFLLEDDRKKKDEIARRMRAAVKALAAVKKKIEENIRIEKQKCTAENRQAIKTIEDSLEPPLPDFAGDRIKKKRTAKKARTAAIPKGEPAAGCHFSKPRIVGKGKPGFAGFPKDFPRPPGLKTGWTLTTATGTLYVLGISGGRLSTVRFVKKALPARGWRILRTKTTRNPGAKAAAVHIFFRNRDYCGWVTITTGAPMPTSMNVFFKKRPARLGGG